MNRIAAIALPTLLMACACVMAAGSDKLVVGAGATPSDAAARAAIVKYFEGRGRVLNRAKPFRVLSGPTLATGNTFAGSLEQAWLMCLVVNAERTQPGPSDLEGQTIYLRRNTAGVVTVVPAENWKDSSPQCDAK